MGSSSNSALHKACNKKDAEGSAGRFPSKRQEVSYQNHSASDFENVSDENEEIQRRYFALRKTDLIEGLRRASLAG